MTMFRLISAASGIYHQFPHVVGCLSADEDQLQPPGLCVTGFHNLTAIKPAAAAKSLSIIENC